MGGEARETPPWGGGNFPGDVPGWWGSRPQSPLWVTGLPARAVKIRGVFLRATKKGAGMALQVAKPKPPVLSAPSR